MPSCLNETIPTTMKAAQAVDYDDVRIVELEVPRPGPGEALVRVAACGICAGDVTPWYIRKKCPIVIGHEPAGQIVALGEGVVDFAVGDRVFVHHHAPCGECRHCQREAYSMCPTWRATNLNPGGIAEYLVVPPTNLSRDTLKLPPEMSYEEGALIEPVACVVKAFHRARIQPGDRVAIVGLGFIGQVMIKLARHYGAGLVMASDLVPYRLEAGRKLGADLVVDASKQSFAEEVRRVTGGDGADIVMVGPSKPAVMEAALACAGQASTVLLFMGPEPGVRWDIDVNYIFFNEISLVSSYSCGPPDTRETMELIRSGVIRADELITHRFPLEQSLEACRLTARAQDSLKVIVSLAG